MPRWPEDRVKKPKVRYGPPKRKYTKSPTAIKAFKERQASFKERAGLEYLLTELKDFRKIAAAKLTVDNPSWPRHEIMRAAWEFAMANFVLSSPDPQIPVKAVSYVTPSGSVIPPVDPSANIQKDLWESALSRECVAGSIEIIQWVFDNLVIPWERIEAELVPSTGAIGMLAEAKDDRKWFFQTCYSKLLNSKAQAAADAWIGADDGMVEEMAIRVKEDLCVVAEDL